MKKASAAGNIVLYPESDGSGEALALQAHIHGTSVQDGAVTLAATDLSYTNRPAA